MRSATALETLAARRAQSDPPVPDYTSDLVEGVVTRLRDIDARIARYAEGWTLERMPAVDRNILRIAVLEMFWRDDVPDRVVIDEAVRLAKTISTDRSPAFVNGLLASLLQEKPEGASEGIPPAGDPTSEPADVAEITDVTEISDVVETSESERT